MRSQTDGRNMVEESILSLLKEIQPTPIRKFYECGLTEAGIRKYSKAYSLSREGLFSLPDLLLFTVHWYSRQRGLSMFTKKHFIRTRKPIGS